MWCFFLPLHSYHATPKQVTSSTIQRFCVYLFKLIMQNFVLTLTRFPATQTCWVFSFSSTPLADWLEREYTNQIHMLLHENDSICNFYATDFARLLRPPTHFLPPSPSLRAIILFTRKTSSSFAIFHFSPEMPNSWQIIFLALFLATCSLQRHKRVQVSVYANCLLTSNNSICAIFPIDFDWFWKRRNDLTVRPSHSANAVVCFSTIETLAQSQ